MPKIMIVDDDATIQMELEESLHHMGHTVGTADTAAGAIEMAREMKPDLILMEVKVRGKMDGISAAWKIKEEMDVAVVFITGFGDPEYIERAKRVEPFGYVMKPFDEQEIHGVIEIALYKKEMELKLRAARDHFEQTNLDLRKEIEARKRTEEVLQNAYDELDVRVEERTAELVKTNEALRESEEKYRSIFQTKGAAKRWQPATRQSGLGTDVLPKLRVLWCHAQTLLKG